MPPSSQDFYICPGCGEDVLVGSSGCLRCAAPPKSKARARRREAGNHAVPGGIHDGLNLPDEEDFDYEAFVRKEFGSPLKPHAIAWHWWVTAVLLLAAFLWSLFGRS